MRSLEQVNIRTNVRTYVLTYIRTGQTLYPLHNFVVRGDNKWLNQVSNLGPLALESDVLLNAPHSNVIFSSRANILLLTVFSRESSFLYHGAYHVFCHKKGLFQFH